MSLKGNITKTLRLNTSLALYSLGDCRWVSVG